jgi:hypothetical protein
MCVEQREQVFEVGLNFHAIDSGDTGRQIYVLAVTSLARTPNPAQQFGLPCCILKSLDRSTVYSTRDREEIE